MESTVQPAGRRRPAERRGFGPLGGRFRRRPARDDRQWGRPCAGTPFDPAGAGIKTRLVSEVEIDAYLGALEEPKRSTLEELRRTILEIIPEAEQGISYGTPAFRVRGKVVAGFAAFTKHLSYLPHSGSVFPQLVDDVAPYVTSTGALRFAVDTPLPKPLVEKLIAVRMAQAFGG